MDRRILGLIATAMECCEGGRSRGRGHPPASLVRVLATLRQFLREARSRLQGVPCLLHGILTWDDHRRVLSSTNNVLLGMHAIDGLTGMVPAPPLAVCSGA